MYKTDFICNYKQHDEEDKEDMYRIQFLQSFDLDKWDENVINSSTEEIYNKFKTNNDLISIINSAKNSEKLMMIKQFIGEDDFTIFKGLFQYDLFDLVHVCLCDLVNSGTIKIINKNNLINNL